MVGAIADQRLAGKEAAAKIAALLNGLTLEEASILPDKIKAWEKQKPENREVVAPGHPEIEKALHDFFDANPFRANPKKGPPSHHWFHYTDVPIFGNSVYTSGATGRSQFDIVKMIPFCVRVLKEKEDENNARKITKPIALILLSHYLGDIHQPLHVGAQYFDAGKKPTNPDDNQGVGFETHGGNNITLILNETSDHGRGQDTSNIHHYWDENAVTTALDILRVEILATRKGGKKVVSPVETARFLASSKPQDWQDSAMKVDKAAEDWANEILPFARQAYDLDYRDVALDLKSNSATAVGVEKKDSKTLYREWAGGVIRHSIHRGGWRLAELLDRTFPSK
jgi:hypothetical protein